MSAQQLPQGYVFPAVEQLLRGPETADRNYVAREVPNGQGARPDRNAMQGLLRQSDRLYAPDPKGDTRSPSEQADAAQLITVNAERFLHAPLNQAGADERFTILIEMQAAREIASFNAAVGRLLKKEGHTWGEGPNAAIEKVMALKLSEGDQARCRMALEPFDVKTAAQRFIAATSGVIPNETMAYAVLQWAVVERQEIALDGAVGGMSGSLMVESDVAYAAFPSIGRQLNNHPFFTRDKHARVHAILQGAQSRTPNFAASLGEIVANAGQWARDRISDAHHDVSTSFAGRASPTFRLATGVVAGTFKLPTLIPTAIGDTVSIVEDSDKRQKLGAGLSTVWSHPGAAYDLARSELATAWSLNGAGMIGEGLGYAGLLGWLGSALQKLGNAASLLEINMGAAQPVLLRVEATRFSELGNRVVEPGNGLSGLGIAPQTAQVSSIPEGQLRHIIQMAPLFKEVPPIGYAGTERIIEYLIQDMLKLGYKVTLVASGDSGMAGANLIAPVTQGLWKYSEDFQKLHAHQIHFDMVKDIRNRALAGEFGPQGTYGLHNHLDYGFMPFPLSDEFANLTTVHGWLGHKDLLQFHDAFRNQPQISISVAQQAYQKDANWVANVHHGLPVDLYHQGPGGDHAVWLGRSALEKGPDAAIRIAQMANVDIRLAGKNSEIAQMKYYEDNVKPLLGKNAQWIGEIKSVEEKQSFLGEAGVCVCSYNWPEPFGMVFIEALATGTPVIAYGLGSVPEIIRPGLNGFFINMADKTAAAIEAEAAALIPKAMKLSRPAIRADFVERFSSMTMARNYVRIFEQENARLQLRNSPKSWPGWSAQLHTNGGPTP